jgi:hypothetical protein
LDWKFWALAVASGVFLLVGEWYRRAHGNREKRYHGDTMKARELQAHLLVVRLAEQLEAAPADSLTCPRCGFTSHNRHDVEQQYCGFCHVFLHEHANWLMMTMSPAERGLKDRLSDFAALYVRTLPDGRSLVVLPDPQGGTLRVCYDGDPHPPSGRDAIWMYESTAFAVIAAGSWDPTKEREPYGWFGHCNSGRRRPHGDRRMEYCLHDLSLQ